MRLTVLLWATDGDPSLHIRKPWPATKWPCTLADSVCGECYNEQGEDNPCRAICEGMSEAFWLFDRADFKTRRVRLTLESWNERRETR